MSEIKVDFSPFCMRARDLISKGLMEDALGLYGDVIHIDPSNAMAYADRGTAYAMMKKFDLALSDLEKAIELGYQDGSTYSSIATVNFELKRYEKSLEYFAKSIELAPNYAITYYNRSNVYYQVGNNKAAIEDLERCLSFEPDENLKKLINERLGFLRAL
jgi:tetratricopeptide (TPR) repeat protein